MNKKKASPNPRLYFKIRKPVRNQLEFQMMALDDLIPEDHKAKFIWNFVQKMNTDPCFQRIKSLICGPGRYATDPELIFCLWLFAYSEGVSGSRQIVERTKHHDAYKWICGGISVNHTMLCEFRSAEPEIFEELLTSSLAVMMEQGFLEAEDIAQDGSKIKAAAGNNTCRREPSIQEQLEKATQYVRKIEEENQKNPDSYNKRRTAAKLRAGNERKALLEQSLEELEKIREIKRQSRRKKKEVLEKEAVNARVSTRDPEARRMKMGDGGFRMAYNLQLATGVASKVIFGVTVINSSDQGEAPRMVSKVAFRRKLLGLDPVLNWLADAAYSSIEDIEGVAERFPETRLVAPGKTITGSDPKNPKKTDSPAVRKWREFLGTDEFKAQFWYLYYHS